MSSGENPPRNGTLPPADFFEVRLPKLSSAPDEKREIDNAPGGRGLDHIALNFLPKSFLVFIVAAHLEQPPTPDKRGSAALFSEPFVAFLGRNMNTEPITRRIRIALVIHLPR